MTAGPSFYKSSCTIVAALALTFSGSALVAQDQPQEKAKPKWMASSSDSGDERLKTELEPGVWIYGQSNRFAEVGESQSFDTSPDGMTMAFAIGNSVKLFDLNENRVVETINTKGNGFQGISYSPDGRHIFAWGYDFVGRQQKSAIRIFDAITHSQSGSISLDVEQEEERPNRNTFYVQKAVVSPDSAYVAVASHNLVQIRDVDSGELVKQFKDLQYVQGLAFSADEKHVYISGNKFIVFDLDSGEEVKKSVIARKAVSHVIDVNYSTGLMASPNGSTIRLFDTIEERSVGTISMPGQTYAQQLAFSDDGSMIAATSWKNDEENGSHFAMVVADVETKKVVKELKLPSTGVQKVRFSSDNSLIFIGGHGIYGVLEIDLSEPDSDVVKNEYPKGPAQSLLLHPDGESFMSCTSGGEVTWFETASGNVIRSMNRGGAKAIHLSEDGKDVLIVSQWGGGSDQMTRHSYKSGEKKRSYGGSAMTAKKTNAISQLRGLMFGAGPASSHRQSFPIAANYSQDGAEIHTLFMEWEYVVHSSGIFGGSDYEQKQNLVYSRINAESGEKEISTKIDKSMFGMSQNEWLQNGAVHPMGAQIAVARNQQVHAVDTETGELIFEVKPFEHAGLRSVAYSPDARYLCVSGHMGVKIYDAETGEELFEKKKATYFAFSKDGSKFAVAGGAKSSSAEVLETENWKQIHMRDGSEASRRSIALSDDGEKLLIGLADCRMELWDFAQMGR